MRKDSATSLSLLSPFVDIRKENFIKDQHQIKKTQLNNQSSIQDIHPVYVAQEYFNHPATIHQRKGIQSSQIKKRSNDPSAVTINAIQFLNNSSIANARTSKTHRYEGSQKFLQNYITSNNTIAMKCDFEAPKFQTLAPFAQLSISTGLNSYPIRRNEHIPKKQLQRNHFVNSSMQHCSTNNLMQNQKNQQTESDWNNSIEYIHNNNIIDGTNQDQSQLLQNEEQKFMVGQQLGQLNSHSYNEMRKLKESQMNRFYFYSSPQKCTSLINFHKKGAASEFGHFSDTKKINVDDYDNYNNKNKVKDMKGTLLSMETQNRVKIAAKEIVQKEIEIDQLNHPKHISNKISQSNILKNNNQSNISQFNEPKSPENESKMLWQLIQNSQKDKSNQEKSMQLIKLYNESLQEGTSKCSWVKQDSQADYQQKLNTMSKSRQQSKRERLIDRFSNISNINSLIPIDQNTIAESMYREGRKILIIEIYNLQSIKTFINLKFCFLNLPLVTPTTLEIHEKIHFKKFKRLILSNLKINANDIFLYKKNGNPLYSHRQLSDTDFTLFAGNCRSFAGIDNIYCTESNLASLKSVIDKLEEKIKDDKGGSDEVDDATPLNQPQSYQKMQSIQTQSNSPQRQQSKMNLESFDKIPAPNDPKSLKKSQFIVRNTSIEIIEEDRQNDIKQPKQKVQVQSYLRNVMKYLDLFFSKFDYHWRTEKEKDEVDLFMKQNLAQPKRLKKHMVLEFKLKAFEARKSKVDQLKKLNIEVFVSKIGAVLQKHQLKESDLNSVYLLYRSILNISSMIISLQEIVKEEDFFMKVEETQKITDQNREFIVSLCDYNNIINWPNFVDLLKNISNKEEEEKITMFVEVFDSDNSGTLSLDEINVFAKQTLDYIINGGKYPQLLDELMGYFTQLLFSSQREEGQTEIPMEKIKQAIREVNKILLFMIKWLTHYYDQKKENADLLCFFCGTSDD